MSSPGEWYAALPPVTKVWLTSAVLSAIGAKLDLLDVKMLLLDWPKVVSKLHVRGASWARSEGRGGALQALRSAAGAGAHLPTAFIAHALQGGRAGAIA